MTADKPFESILDRKEAVENIKKHYQEQLDLLQEMANYGSNLIVRCYGSSQYDLPAVVVLAVLLKHVVAMIDATEILVSQGAILSANLPARSLFETCLYIEWILKDDTEKRAKQYYVRAHRQGLGWSKRCIGGSEEKEYFVKAVGDFGDLFSEKSKKRENKAKKRVESKEALLAKDEYLEINEAFERIKKKHKLKYDVAWYYPNGPKSVSQIAKELGKGAQYHILYSHYSDIMHGGDLFNHITFGNKSITFVPIRHLEGIDILLTSVFSYSMDIYRIVLEYYRPGEIGNFKTKYASEWRTRFKTIKKVNYIIETSLLDF